LCGFKLPLSALNFYLWHNLRIMATVKHYHHHYHFSYTTSLKRHFTITVAVLIGLAILLPVGFEFITPLKHPSLVQISAFDLATASFFTLLRLIIAYLLSLLISISLALLITATPKLERFLLPLFDIIQSVPILAFFPLIVLIFIKLNLLEGAAVFVLLMSMLWGLTFNMVGGIKTIPEDIKNAAFLFKATGFKKLRYIILPAIFPYIVTGSLLSFGAGWNILIVAEVLHTYIPKGSSSSDLFGLGSLLVNSTLSGQTYGFISTLLVMITLIGLINFFIWQKLLHLAERYKFD